MTDLENAVLSGIPNLFNEFWDVIKLSAPIFIGIGIYDIIRFIISKIKIN